MSDTKLLQGILDKVSSLDRKMDTGFKEVNENFSQVNGRLDTIGLNVARLEDDAPTINEFNKLVRRVTKLENRLLEN